MSGLLQTVVAASKRRGPVYDADAQAYFGRLVAAGTDMSATNKAALNALVLGLKADAGVAALADHPIKGMLLFAGHNSFEGCFVPLIGVVPTNYNFVSTDYDRLTGLVGNGSNKSIGTNRNHNADAKDNQHTSVWVTSRGSSNTAYFGAGSASNSSGTTNIYQTASAYDTRSQSATAVTAGFLTTGILGVSRSNSSNYSFAYGNSVETLSRVNFTPFNGELRIFARGDGGQASSARLKSFTVGSALSLAALRDRLATYFAAIV